MPESMNAFARALIAMIGLSLLFIASLDTARAGQVAPAAPTSLIAAAPYDVVFVGLQWQDNADNEDSYIVERSTAGADGPWVVIATLPAVTTNAGDSNVAARTTYWYRVAAANEAGQSEYSNVSMATTDAPYPQPPLGDVNLDMRIDSLDALWLAQYIAGLILTLQPPQNADVNQDGLLDAVDVVLILQYDAGLVPSLPPP